MISKSFAATSEVLNAFGEPSRVAVTRVKCGGRVEHAACIGGRRAPDWGLLI